MKQINLAKKGKKAPEYFEYLNELSDLLSNKAPKNIDFNSIDDLLFLLKCRAAFHCEETHKLFDDNKEIDKKIKDNEMFALNVQKMTKYHLTFAMVRMAYKFIDSAELKD